jgi:hypothetical protein
MQILTNNHIHMEGIKNCEVGLSIIFFSNAMKPNMKAT